MYGINNLIEEALAWYDVLELIKQTALFPVICKAMITALTLPANNLYGEKQERSFSAVRRVKT